MLFMILTEDSPDILRSDRWVLKLDHLALQVLYKIPLSKLQVNLTAVQRMSPSAFTCSLDTWMLKSHLSLSLSSHWPNYTHRCKPPQGQAIHLWVSGSMIFNHWFTFGKGFVYTAINKNSHTQRLCFALFQRQWVSCPNSTGLQTMMPWETKRSPIMTNGSLIW